MLSARNVLAPTGRRGLLRSLVAGSAVAVSVVLPGAVAAADEPDGTTVVGRLVQAWPEVAAGSAEPGAVEGPISWVEPAAGDAVRVPTEDVEGIPSGATVEVTVDGHHAGEDDPLHEVLDTGVVTLPAAPVPTPTAGLTNQVTVALVTPDGVGRDAVTEQQLIDVVDGPVADFWSEETDGAIRLGVTTAHDWVTPDAGCSDPTAMWNEVAATVGFVPGPGKHLLLYVSSRATGCAYALGEVGAAPGSGGRMYVRNTGTSVIAHEFGHNFGLGHSSGRQCDAAVESDACRTVGYRDYYDVMGVSWAQLGSLNAPQAARLSLLPAARQQSLTVSGSPVTVTLAPISGRTGTRALRLTDAEGSDYWLEYRPASGRDAWLGTAANRYGLDAGVLLRHGEGLPDTSVLLDATPAPAGDWNADHQAALPLGTAVPVSGGDFTVVVQGLGPAGAVVSITPAASVSPAAAVPVGRSPSGAPGGVMSGTGHEAAPEAASSPQFWAPEHRGTRAFRDTGDLAPAGDSSTVGGFVVALTASALAGSALLVVRVLRRTARNR
ncbi:MAG TPA: zinc-dependent metalloprotease family protein [Blastococcus sp.]